MAYHREFHGASQSFLSSGGPLKPGFTWVGFLALLGLDVGVLSKPWAKEEVGRSDGNSLGAALGAETVLTWSEKLET